MFKIVQLADLHLGQGADLDAKTMQVIHRVLEAEKPIQLVVLSGDMVSGYAWNGSAGWYKAGWQQLADALAQHRVHYAITLGNHDGEADLTRAEVMALDMTNQPWSFSHQGPAHLTGASNYFIDILPPPPPSTIHTRAHGHGHRTVQTDGSSSSSGSSGKGDAARWGSGTLLAGVQGHARTDQAGKKRGARLPLQDVGSGGGRRAEGGARRPAVVNGRDPRLDWRPGLMGDRALRQAAASGQNETAGNATDLAGQSGHSAWEEVVNTLLLPAEQAAQAIPPNVPPVAARIWMLDTMQRGCGNEMRSWGCAGLDTLAWVRTVAASLPRARVQLAVAHIPVPEFMALYNTGGDDGGATLRGGKAEDVSCPATHTDTGMFDVLRSIGVTSLHSGHDHDNWYHGTFRGVRLSYGVKTGYASYGPSPGWHGAKVMLLRLGVDPAHAELWVRLENGTRLDLQAPQGRRTRPQDYQGVCNPSGGRHFQEVALEFEPIFK